MKLTYIDIGRAIINARLSLSPLGTYFTDEKGHVANDTVRTNLIGRAILVGKTLQMLVFD